MRNMRNDLVLPLEEFLLSHDVSSLVPLGDFLRAIATPLTRSQAYNHIHSGRFQRDYGITVYVSSPSPHGKRRYFVETHDPRHQRQLAKLKEQKALNKAVQQQILSDYKYRKLVVPLELRARAKQISSLYCCSHFWAWVRSLTVHDIRAWPRSFSSQAFYQQNIPGTKTDWEYFDALVSATRQKKWQLMSLLFQQFPGDLYTIKEQARFLRRYLSREINFA